MGCIYRRGKIYWLKYYQNGEAIRESSGSTKESDAKRLLRQREGDVEKGIPVTPKLNRATLEELLGDVVTDYRVNARRSLSDLERRIRLHLLPFFRGRIAINITAADIRKYVELRQAEKASNGQINRELAVLRRAFSLGVEAVKVTMAPKFSLLQENNVRVGFFERDQFEAVRRYLPEELKAVITFAFITGWRVNSEVLPLQWRQVDFDAGTIRLDAGMTKNGEGRVFPFTAELRSLLGQLRANTTALERQNGLICPWVFHRNGKQIRNFRRAWITACKKAGCPSRIPHDLRRTAVRNLVRAGVPERVAMTLTGHKTRAVFERYNIVSEADLVSAAVRLGKAANGDS